MSPLNTDCRRERSGSQACSLHISTLYDILSGSFVDCDVERGVGDERDACLRMMEGMEEPSIVICDRGYESYNLFAHLMHMGHCFLIRVKDALSESGIAPYWRERLGGPDGEGEVLVDTRLTRIGSKAVKDSPLFHHLCPANPFDFLPPASPFRRGPRKDTMPEDIPPEQWYRMTFRLVRFRIGPPGSGDEFETVATNLPADEFPADELRRLYGMRWDEETAFRKLKYDALLARLHSVKAESVAKEIYMALMLHNMTAFIIEAAGERRARTDRGKGRRYAISHSDATHAVRLFLRGRCGPRKLVQELARNMEPVRDNRPFPRPKSQKGFVAFTYRAA